MKSSIISLLLVLVIMIVVPLILLGDNDLAEQLGLTRSATNSGFDGNLPTGMSNVVTDKRVEVYRWVDESGVTQFSHAPPEHGGEAELVVLEPDTNIMEPVKLPEPEPETLASPSIVNVGDSLPEGGTKDILDQSAGLEGMLQQPPTDQQKMLNELLKQK